MTLKRVLFCAVFAVTFAAPVAWAQGRADVTLYAPARLKEALDQLAREYERQGRARAMILYEVSPELARRIEQGGVADLLISDDPESLDLLAKRGLIRVETRVNLVTGSGRTYHVAVVASTRSKLAYDYLRYLRSHAAQNVWQRHGFSSAN